MKTLSLPKLKKKTQAVFNAWVRRRDKGKPCMACRKHSDNMHASHYIAMGSSSFLRYHPDNVWSTCAGCNLFKRGNLIEYRIGLVAEIGEERVRWLEDHRHTLKKHTREELLEIIRNCKEVSTS